jgi:glutathione peroxidase
MITFWGYVEIVNIHSKNMTGRQKILKAVYPLFTWFSRVAGKNTNILSHAATAPPVSFYTLNNHLIDGKAFDFALLKGKKVLLVNTASDCGYTGQYDELEKLYSQYSQKLVVIGFPANDFKEQEKGTNETIAQFCKANFGVTFPLMAKSVVIKNNDQNTVFKWLTDASQNGWNNKAPSWNFSKYLVNENGSLIHYFDPSVSPLSKEVTEAIER